MQEVSTVSPHDRSPGRLQHQMSCRSLRLLAAQQRVEPDARDAALHVKVEGAADRFLQGLVRQLQVRHMQAADGTKSRSRLGKRLPCNELVELVQCKHQLFVEGCVIVARIVEDGTSKLAVIDPAGPHELKSLVELGPTCTHVRQAGMK
eukprot:759597-Hanusia_phi.AAC.1